MASLLDEPGGVCSVSPSRTSRLASVTTASGRRSSISAMAALFQARQSGSSGFTSDTVENERAGPAHDRDQLPAVAAGGRDQCAGELLQVRVADQHDALGRLLLDRLGAAAHREAGHQGAVPALGAHPSRREAAAQGHGSVTSQS
jgi:hypothetical protein